MSNMNFVKGIGIGIVVGSAIGAAVAPSKRARKTMVGKTVRTVGEIIDNISSTFSM